LLAVRVSESATLVPEPLLPAALGEPTVPLQVVELRLPLKESVAELVIAQVDVLSVGIAGVPVVS
jgi:hypothetical protein